MSKDPTKTLTLRNRAAREIDLRFNRLKKAVRSVFNEGKMLTNVRLAGNGEFQFVRDDQKVPEFEKYLAQQIEKEILRIDGLSPAEQKLENHWLNKSIGEGYRRGAVKTRLAGERNIPGLAKLPSYSPFANPAHVERAELMFQRVYTDLEGVTKAMSGQMSRVLSDGILKGENPKKVAAKMNDRIDKIGKTRSKLIARTEIIEAHNTAAIKEAEQLEEDTGVAIHMKWITSIDGRQRHTHEARHNKIYTRGKAQAMIGEPNCRCSVTAYFDVDGEDEDETDNPRELHFDIEGSIELEDRNSFGKTYRSVTVDNTTFRDVSFAEDISVPTNLSDSHKSALLGYTKDDYFEINRHLRGVEVLSDSDWEGFAKQSEVLSSIIKKAPALEEDILVYRNLRKVGEPFIEGSSIVDAGFGSTTKFSETYSLMPNPDVTVYKTTILLPKGVKGVAGIQKYSQASNEAEILLDKGSKFFVKKINELSNGVKELILIKTE